MMSILVAFLFALHVSAQSAPLSGHFIKLDSATLVGTGDRHVSKYLGIPYAEPPIRYREAEASSPYTGVINATRYGLLCPQQKLNPPSVDLPDISNIISQTPELHDAPGIESEDCLTINVIRPAGLSKNLPIVVWIHGGAYQIGDTASYDTMGTHLVERSLALRKPVIYVSMNYRLSAYGFLGGQEISAEGVGNLGLKDQRLALQWVQKYIGAFGGDKTKVTIWGQSSGAISVSLQMLAFGGNTGNLFRAGFMQSGSPLGVKNTSSPISQSFYNTIVSQAGCSGQSNTLDCLRSVPFPVLKAAVDQTPNFFSYQSLILVWHPSIDGVFIQDDPRKLVQEGKFPSLPIVSGACDDEGTLFALSSQNITTDAEFRQYIQSIWFPTNTDADLEPLFTFYPSDAAEGSPFNTSAANALTPQFMRMAAFQGDSVQQAPRRLFLQQVSGKQKVFSYLSKRAKATPGLGSYHGSDLSLNLTEDHLINFVTDLDPNIGTRPVWPQYTPQSPLLYTFPVDGPPTITADTFRATAIQYLSNLSFPVPLTI